MKEGLLSKFMILQIVLACLCFLIVRKFFIIGNAFCIHYMINKAGGERVCGR